jgi:hypothetical protein
MLLYLKRLFWPRGQIKRLVDENDSDIAQDLSYTIKWRIDQQRLRYNLTRLEERIASQETLLLKN